jgi:exodeoxyribonuclease VII small subunit
MSGLPATLAPVTGQAGGRPSGNGGEPDGQLPYEQARDQLTEVVRRLEGGGLTLEESLALWERGEKLAAICSQWLEGARARLTAARPADPEDPGDATAPF